MTSQLCLLGCQTIEAALYTWFHVLLLTYYFRRGAAILAIGGALDETAIQGTSR